jgi:hypothetical protein
LGCDVNKASRHEITVFRLIFWRWVQENDFKYLDKHFGINQITSYPTVDYEELAQTIDDKQMKNGQHQALENEKRALKRELGRLLVAQRAHRARQRRKTRGTQTPAGAQETETKRQERIGTIDLRIKELDALLESTTREVSRLETLIAQKKQRLDTGNKSVMDAIKVLARNAFTERLRPSNAPTTTTATTTIALAARRHLRLRRRHCKGLAVEMNRSKQRQQREKDFSGELVGLAVTCRMKRPRFKISSFSVSSVASC